MGDGDQVVSWVKAAAGLFEARTRVVKAQTEKRLAMLEAGIVPTSEMLDSDQAALEEMAAIDSQVLELTSGH